jgi:hypothetical protein
MADVEIAVGLRREAGDHPRHAAGGEIRSDDVADEVACGVLVG